VRPRALAGALVGLVACASAGVNGGGGDDGSGSSAIDARPPDDGRIDGPTIDAAVVDSGPVDITLTQTTSAMVGSNNSIACGNPDGTTAENSWYRVFRLADANITNGLRVVAVTFGVQESLGMPAVQVKIGTYSGSLVPPPSQLDTGLISPIAAVTFNVPNTTSTAPMAVTVPIIANVPALSQMVVEVFAPNLNGTSKYFYLGGNNLGEAKPAYLRAPTGTCATPQPKSTSALGFPMSHLVISVAGTH
jgi:hypothetical protein